MPIAKEYISKNDYADNGSGKAPNFVFNAHSKLAMGLWHAVSLGEHLMSVLNGLGIKKTSNDTLLLVIFFICMCHGR